MGLREMVPNFTAGGTIFTDAQEVAATWQIGLNLVGGLILESEELLCTRDDTKDK